MTSLLGQKRRNPFYQAATDILEKNGFKHYYIDHGPNGTLFVKFKCMSTIGIEIERKYSFPTKVGSFDALPNFTSQFKRFLHNDIMAKGVTPLPDPDDTRLRRNNTKTFQLDQNKPKVVEMQTQEPLKIAAPAKKQTVSEKLAELNPDDMVRVSYLMKASDVMTVAETLRGTATLVSFKVHEPVIRVSASAGERAVQ